MKRNQKTKFKWKETKKLNLNEKEPKKNLNKKKPKN